MSTIREISIEGFRSISVIDRLELRPVNVLIGANGSGKSNLLRAIDLLRIAMVNPERIPNYAGRVGGADRLLHFGSGHTDRISLRAKFGGGFSRHIADYGVVLSHAAGDSLICGIESSHTVHPIGVQAEATVEQARNQQDDYIRGNVDGWRVFHFHDTGRASPIKKTVKIDDNRRLREDGSNLAAFLYLLRKRYRRDYDMIRNCVRLAVPFFEDFSLHPAELNRETIRLEWRHRGSDNLFDSSALSDGTLRFIALTTVLLQPELLRPSVVLLDEPELGLHPAAITLLTSMIGTASVSSQVMVATQSPRLLDHFEPEDVLAAERVAGATEFHRLESERLKVWLEDYSLGELWEKNHFGGRSSSWTENPARKSRATEEGVPASGQPAAQLFRG